MASRLGWMVAAVSALGGWATGCVDDSDCANTEQSRARAPNGAVDAVVFIRDCGATTDYSTQVALVAAGTAPPNRPANVFINAHEVPTSVIWHGSDTLEVRHEQAVPVLRATRVNGVTVRYTGAP